jgi:O-antigen/teichoic acid export membrane protein
LGLLMTIAGAATAPALLVALLRGLAAGMHAWGAVAAERVMNGGLRIVGIFTVAAFGHLTLAVATAIFVLAPVFAGLAYLALLGKSSPAQTADLPPTPVGKVFRYGLKAWLGSVAGILLMRVDQLLILPIAGPAQLGLYAVAVNVSEVPLIINSATREVTFSSDAAEHDNARAGRAARMTFIACLLCAVLVLAPVEWWLPLVFGEEFRAAVPVAVVATLAVVVGVPGSIAGSTLSARGRPELRSFAILAACLVNLAALFALLPGIGGLGAAVATLLGNLVSSNICIWWAVKLHRFAWSDFYRVRASDISALGRSLRKLRG